MHQRKRIPAVKKPSINEPEPLGPPGWGFCGKNTRIYHYSENSKTAICHNGLDVTFDYLEDVDPITHPNYCRLCYRKLESEYKHTHRFCAWCGKLLKNTLRISPKEIKDKNGENFWMHEGCYYAFRRLTEEKKDD